MTSSCLYYVLRPTLAVDRDRVISGAGIPARLDWQIDHASDAQAQARSGLHRDLATLLQEMSGPVAATATWSGDGIDQEPEIRALTC